MSWMRALYETYKACVMIPKYTQPSHTGVSYKKGETPEPSLMPICHVSQQAHIVVTLDAQGNFFDATLLPAKTSAIIPATEDSAGRTSGGTPHPLMDKIHYCAKDYRGTKKNLFSLYYALLSAWCDASPLPKLQAIRTYVDKGTLVHDLAEKGILFLEPDGTLATQAPDGEKDSLFQRVASGNQGDALVLWNVLLAGEKEFRVWEDAELQQSWIAYELQQREERGFCMVQGKDAPLISKHPRNIRNPGDGAKLISSNDTSGFSFRGHFLDADQANSIGYETSQMAHNALRWLIARQGWKLGSQVVLAWAVNGCDSIPSPCEDLPKKYYSAPKEDRFAPVEETEQPSLDASAHQGGGYTDVGASFAEKIGRTLRGYKALWQKEEVKGISILALDSASPGRLAVTYYREQLPEEYLDRLQAWQVDVAWRMSRFVKNQGWIREERAPIPVEIIKAAYGTQEVNNSLGKATVARLLPCIVEKAALPRDLVALSVARTCQRSAKFAPTGAKKSEEWTWRQQLEITCALYKGYYARCRAGQRRSYSMSLEEHRTSRDYLFGRLLAVAEFVEKKSLEIAKENRPTNAERLFQRFADHPYSTWRTLEMQLNPYWRRLQSNMELYGGFITLNRKRLQSIMDMFAPEDFTNDTKLSGEFLLGYHCQMSNCYTKTSQNTDDASQGDDI